MPASRFNAERIWNEFLVFFLSIFVELGTVRFQLAGNDKCGWDSEMWVKWGLIAKKPKVEGEKGPVVRSELKSFSRSRRAAFLGEKGLKFLNWSRCFFASTTNRRRV
jgi:hypothetical protein